MDQDDLKEKVYHSEKYRRSRRVYIAQCSIEYCISLLVADAFLANLLSSMGISDSLTGIIASFISFAFLFQLLSIFLVRRIRDIKKTVIFLNCLSQFLFMGMYIVPFLAVSKTIKTIILIAFILFAYFSNYIVSGVLFKWANSFVNPNERAEYSAAKEIVSLVGGILFTLIIGQVIDRYAKLNNVEGGFLFIACAMLILNICNFVCLMGIPRDSVAMKEERMISSSQEVSFFDVIKNTLGNREFLNIVIMTIMHYCARFITIGFLGTFKTRDLLISVGMVQIINIIGNVARIAVSKRFGRFSDKTSFARGMSFGLTLEALSYMAIIFATPKTWWLVILHTILYSVSMAGTNQNSFNIIYSYVDSKYIVQAMAIKNSIAGIIGFAISLLGGRILAVVQNRGYRFMGAPVYGQQLLSIISVLILMLTVLFNYLVIEKQEVKKQ